LATSECGGVECIFDNGICVVLKVLSWVVGVLLVGVLGSLFYGIEKEVRLFSGGVKEVDEGR
jgi:hypothetical protein